MVLGGVDSDRIQINEHTLWSGGPGADENYDGGQSNQSEEQNHATLKSVRESLQSAMSDFTENHSAYKDADGTFRPNDTVRRAEYVTFQWRAAGEPEVSTTKNPFTDVSEAAFPHYIKAILWAYENGITEGKTATTFQPNNECSRANVVTFLYRGEVL